VSSRASERCAQQGGHAPTGTTRRPGPGQIYREAGQCWPAQIGLRPRSGETGTPAPLPGAHRRPAKAAGPPGTLTRIRQPAGRNRGSAAERPSKRLACSFRPSDRQGSASAPRWRSPHRFSETAIASTKARPEQGPGWWPDAADHQLSGRSWNQRNQPRSSRVLRVLGGLSAFSSRPGRIPVSWQQGHGPAPTSSARPPCPLGQFTREIQGALASSSRHCSKQGSSH